jgi:hypothetical protein
MKSWNWILWGIEETTTTNMMWSHITHTTYRHQHRNITTHAHSSSITTTWATDRRKCSAQLPE